MNKLLFVLLILAQSPVIAVPVVPNFSSGSVTSSTRSTSSTTELIKSYSFQTGYQSAVGCTNCSATGNLSPVNKAVGTQTVNGTTTSWTGVESMPTYTQTVPGAPTNFTQSYSGPGLSNYTLIERSIEIESITDSTSTFTQ